MQAFTGIIGSDKNTTVGAWLTNKKGQRERCLSVVTQNFPGYKDDMAYLGYYTDQLTVKGGCNFSIALGDGEVIIQSSNPETGEVSQKAIPADKFFDLMDMLAVVDVPALLNTMEKAGKL